MSKSYPDLEGMDQSQLIEQLLHEEEMNRRLEKDRLSLYRPLDTVLPFHKSTASTRCLSGGERGGKTTAGPGAEAGWHFTGRYPDWYPQENRLPRPFRGRLIGPDYKTWAREVLEPKLAEWWPDWASIEQKAERDSTTHAITELNHPDGSRINILSYMQAPKLHKGWSGHWAGFDEPPPREHFLSTKRGLVDYGGKCILTFTLITEPWILNDLYEPAVAGDPDIGFFFTSMDDNPYLESKEIDNYCRFLDPAEVETRRHGRFGMLSGRIYKIFNRKVHGIDLAGPKAIPRHWQRTFVIDPHDNKPVHCAWVALSPPAPVSFAVWYRHAVLSDMTIPQVCRYVKELEEQNNELIHRRIMDPNFGRKMQGNTKTRVQQDYASNGLSCILPDDALQAGHLRVRSWLHYDVNRPVGRDNFPRVYFANYLTTMIQSMEKYAYAAGPGGRPALVGDAVPDETWKDPCDLVRYYFMMNPVWEHPDWKATESGVVVPITSSHRRGYTLDQ